jgi:hypothetical protein
MGSHILKFQELLQDSEGLLYLWIDARGAIVGQRIPNIGNLPIIPLIFAFQSIPYQNQNSTNIVRKETRVVAEQQRLQSFL